MFIANPPKEPPPPPPAPPEIFLPEVGSGYGGGKK
jgi:hypothetical protein